MFSLYLFINELSYHNSGNLVCEILWAKSSPFVNKWRDVIWWPLENGGDSSCASYVLVFGTDCIEVTDWELKLIYLKFSKLLRTEDLLLNWDKEVKFINILLMWISLVFDSCVPLLLRCFNVHGLLIAISSKILNNT